MLLKRRMLKAYPRLYLRRSVSDLENEVDFCCSVVAEYSLVDRLTQEYLEA